MRATAVWVLLASLFVAANVVAAGVMLILGRALQEDDKVILNTTRPVHMRVAQITPALDPKLPPGAVHIHLGVLLTLTVQKGRPVLEILRIATGAESEPNPLRMVNASSVTADPGGVQ